MYSKVNTKWEKKQFSDLISVSIDEEDILKSDGSLSKPHRPSGLNHKYTPEVRTYVIYKMYYLSF